MSNRRNIVKAESTKKNEAEEKKRVSAEVDMAAQARLVEILTDSPRIVALNGTEWEIRALRMGTQYLIAQKVIEINEAKGSTFGDIINQFAVNIPAVIDVITLALLNDKNKIFKDGIEGGARSELYNSTYQTLMWDCDVSRFGDLLLEVLQLIDTNFFMVSCRILDMFRMSTTARTTIELK